MVTRLLSRLVLILPLAACGLSLAACGASAPISQSQQVPEPVAYLSVQLPDAPSEAPTKRSALSRSAIQPATYVLAFDGDSHHGCSRSWTTTTTNGTASLQLTPQSATLRWQAQVRHRSGSMAMGPASEYASDETVSAVYSGAVVEQADGIFQATLKKRDCEGRCDDEELALSCRPTVHKLSDRAKPEAEPGVAGSVTGYLCEVPQTLVPGSELTSLPFAAGLGLKLEASGYRFGGIGQLFRNEATQQASL